MEIIGVYSKELATELPRAYVMLKEVEQRREETAEEIVKWTQERVASHKRLRGGVRFVDEIPKSASGKILRRVLKVKAEEEEKGGEGLKAKL